VSHSPALDFVVDALPACCRDCADQCRTRGVGRADATARQCGRSCVMRQDYLGRRRWWHERRVGRRERVRRRRHRPRRSVRRSLRRPVRVPRLSLQHHAEVQGLLDGSASSDLRRRRARVRRLSETVEVDGKAILTREVLVSKSTVTGAYRVSGSSSKRRKRLTNSPPRRPPGSLRVADASCASDRGAAAKVSPCVRDFRRGC
jgi:hypothetical protein